MPRQFSVPRRPAGLLAGASSCWRRSPSACSRLRRRHPRPDPALLGRRVRRASRSARPAWSATGCRDRDPGWRWRLSINAFGGVLTGGRPRRGRVGEVRRRRLPRGHPHPAPRGDDAVHPPPVRDRSARELAVRPDLVVAPPASRGARRRARSRASTGRSSRRSTSAARSPTTSGPSTSPTTPRPPRRSASDGSARCRASRSSSSSRRTGRSSGRCSPTSTSSTRPGRRTSRRRSRSSSPRVRRPPLVGADPLQPVGEAPAKPPSSVGRTRSSSTSRTGARTRRRSTWPGRRRRGRLPVAHPERPDGADPTSPGGIVTGRVRYPRSRAIPPRRRRPQRRPERRPDRPARRELAPGPRPS